MGGLKTLDRVLYWIAVIAFMAAAGGIGWTLEGFREERETRKIRRVIQEELARERQGVSRP